MMSELQQRNQARLLPEKPEIKSGYLAVGRTNQKMRTRDALVAAAVEDLRAGRPISVQEIADRAGISRTTAYRYFSTSEVLKAQAAVAAADVKEIDQIYDAASDSLPSAERVDAVISLSDSMTAAHEAGFRSLVRQTVEKQGDERVPRRPTHRKSWMENALADFRGELGEVRFARLTAALCMLCGIESKIVLSDICHLPDEEALLMKRWMAQQLVQAARVEASQAKDGGGTPDPLMMHIPLDSKVRRRRTRASKAS